MKQNGKIAAGPKQKKKNFGIPISPVESKFSGFFKTLPALLLTATLFLVPFFPDEKLNRLKLITFGAGLILSTVFWAVSTAMENSWSFYRTPLDPYLAIYFVSAILYYRASPNLSVAASELERMIFSVGAYLAAVQIASRFDADRTRKMILRGWIGGLFLISVYGILQKSGGIGRLMVPQMDRVFATFGNPIFFAAFLIISIPLVFACLLCAQNFFLRWFLRGTLILSAGALFCTGTRAAFLALPAAMVPAFLFLEIRSGWQWSKNLWQSKVKIFTLIAGVIAAHFALTLFSDGYSALAQKAKSAVAAARMGDVKQTHTLIWKDVLKMWKAHKIFGTGYGTFHIEFPQYASEELKKVFPQESRIVNDAHNEYLQILAETGLVGFLIFISMIVVFYLSSLKNFWALSLEESREPLILGVGLLCGITAMLMENFFSVDMRFIVSSTYLFFAMGLVGSFSSRRIEMNWSATGWPRLCKSAWVVAFLLLSGVVGYGRNPSGIYLGGIYRWSKDDQGLWHLEKTAASGPGLIPTLIRPYMAQKEIARTPDFFDEKLLNAAQTISDLENLVRQYPAQAKYWEKLGFALAKEIQRKENGSKVNDLGVAERSIAAYKKAYELNPALEGPPNNLGNIYYTLNQRQQAIEWWKKAIDANPDKIDARLNLGLAYYYQGKVKEAATQFEEVLKRDPKNERAIVMLKRMVE